MKQEPRETTHSRIRSIKTLDSKIINQKIQITYALKGKGLKYDYRVRDNENCTRTLKIYFCPV